MVGRPASARAKAGKLEDRGSNPRSVQIIFFVFIFFGRGLFFGYGQGQHPLDLILDESLPSIFDTRLILRIREEAASYISI